MKSSRLPLLVEAEELKHHLHNPDILVVDLSRRETHRSLHVPGAVFLDYGQIVAAHPPATGLLPDNSQISRALSGIGLMPQTHVVTYDDEGGGKAARLLWTLETIDHPGGYSLLDGGLHAWANERHPLTSEEASVAMSDYLVRDRNHDPIADRTFIRNHLADPTVALLDARSADEYAGRRRYAQRGGHIPGAVNMEWTQAMDQERNLRLRPADDLRRDLAQLGIRQDQTVVTYCQSHHRSAHTWFVLHYLGYRAKGYAGSWSEWGNTPEMPVE